MVVHIFQIVPRMGKDQIENQLNGLISDMDSSSLANNIEKIINSYELKSRLIRNLAEEKLGNEDEIKKLYDCMKWGENYESYF